MSSAPWEQFNCYAELEISPAASPQEIRKARNEASAQHHPDRGGSHEGQVRINLAYQVLSNPITRQAHDIHWRIFEPDGFGLAIGLNGSVRSRVTAPGPLARSEPLGGFRRRVYNEVEKQKGNIWRDLRNRAQKTEAELLIQYSHQCRRAILTFIGLITVGALSLQYPVFWMVAFVLACFCLSTLLPVRIAGRAFSIIDPTAVYNLREHAYELAKQSGVADLKKAEAYISSLASLSQLLFRASTLDDSEEQVARRLIVSFFLMGYIPILFDKQHRTLTFTDGGEIIMARFRHRDGRPTNVTYVKKLVRLMTEQGISRGFLFCSSGLSGNADDYARKERIICYQLESMNEWVDQVLVSDYSGPTGEVLDNLDKLQRFIGYISTEFAQ